jgi:hypothetical protein
MKLLPLLVFGLLISSCATEKTKFNKEKVCSHEALRYLRNPRNIEKRALNNPKLIQDVAASKRGMQLCYEDFKGRTGHDEFTTCVVVGVDGAGDMEFYNFDSKEVELDDQFMRCAKDVTNSIPYSSYGTNYVLIQSYDFYVGEK